jgi:hypothetical protein
MEMTHSGNTLAYSGKELITTIKIITQVTGSSTPMDIHFFEGPITQFSSITKVHLHFRFQGAISSSGS